jgi:hypothetical protein
LGDISLIYSYCCFMVPDHETCMFKAVKLWIKFETSMF